MVSSAARLFSFTLDVRPLVLAIYECPQKTLRVGDEPTASGIQDGAIPHKRPAP